MAHPARKLRATLTTTALPLALLAACAVPAGEYATSAYYGEATATNIIRQIAYADLEGRLIELNDRFRAAATDTVNFEFDSSRLDGAARAALDTQVAWLKAHPDVRMTVVGHTDLVGPDGYNSRLGLRRAQAVVRYLVSKGIERTRLIAAESRGETEPVIQTQDRERANRRAVTMVAGFVRGYVGDGIDGEYAARVYDLYQAGGEGVTSASSTDATGGQ